MLQSSHAKILLAALLVVTPFLGAGGSAQSKVGPPFMVEDVDCNSEEHVKAILDFAYIEQKKDETIFLIAHLGTGEPSRELIKDRLYAPRQYLLEYRKAPADKVVAAAGERVRGPGQVELYVNGKLYAVFKMKRHRTFTQNRYCKVIYN
jgi:hypothetical protein